MRFFSLLLAVFLLNTLCAFSQEKNLKHTVSKGETISKIAREYHVTINEIFELNPDSKKGLQIKDVILIPNKNFKQKITPEIAAVSNTIIHKVLLKETIYGLAKQYHISSDQLYQYNPSLKETGLKVDQELIIPSNELRKVESVVTSDDVAVNKTNAEIQKPIGIETKLEEHKFEEKIFVHEVQPKESKYRIAKEYGISVAELENQNPEVKKMLPVGFKLNIKTSKHIASKTEVKQEAIVQNETINEVEKPLEINDLIEKLISSASENLGTRYRSGGTSKEGFDCSGLMYSTFGQYKIKLPRSSHEQAEYGVAVKTEEAQKGDLIFFKTSKRRQINHVGMVVEVKDGEIKFIHSSTSSGVMISSTKEPYYEKNFAQVNRVL